MARGRLMTSGRLSEMLEFRVRGWDVVASAVSDPLLAEISAGAVKTTTIGHGRYAFELPIEPPPDRVIARLTAEGATLVSVNPVRDTLEDLFVRQVTSAGATGHDRGLGTPAAGDAA
jgi:hypothetical protein